MQDENVERTAAFVRLGVWRDWLSRQARRKSGTPTTEHTMMEVAFLLAVVHGDAPIRLTAGPRRKTAALEQDGPAVAQGAPVKAPAPLLTGVLPPYGHQYVYPQPEGTRTLLRMYAPRGRLYVRDLRDLVKLGALTEITAYAPPDRRGAEARWVTLAPALVAGWRRAGALAPNPDAIPQQNPATFHHYGDADVNG
jgi:hypothetical protein